MILVVDDDAQVRRILGRIIEQNGHECRLVGTADAARVTLAEVPCELVLCDVMMPGESGVSLLRDLRVKHAGLPVVMVSGVSDTEIASQALELGAFGYVTKPFDMNQVLIAVDNALRRTQLEADNAKYRSNLDELVVQRTAELADACTRLENTEEQLRLSSEETVRALSQAIEGRDADTGQHIARMSRYTALLAQHYGLDAETCELIRLASPMHDVGKIAVPDAILFKPGRLTSAEFLVIQQHAEAGFQILSKSEHPLLCMAAELARTHHERWDGDGYPQGLTGKAIPVGGRLTAVADVFDALVSRRVYKPPMPLEQAIGIMHGARATQFDPDVLDLFIDHIDDFDGIRAEYSDG